MPINTSTNFIQSWGLHMYTYTIKLTSDPLWCIPYSHRRLFIMTSSWLAPFAHLLLAPWLRSLQLLMRLWSHLLHHVCMSLVQPTALMHQPPCAIVSLASTSLVWSNRTVPWLCLFQLLLPTASASAAAPRLHPLQLAAPQLCPLQLPLSDCVLFSCCSPSTSTYHAHTVQSIVSTKVAHHYCSAAPWTSHFCYTQRDTQTHINLNYVLMYMCIPCFFFLPLATESDVPGLQEEVVFDSFWVGSTP